MQERIYGCKIVMILKILGIATIITLIIVWHLMESMPKPEIVNKKEDDSNDGKQSV